MRGWGRTAGKDFRDGREMRCSLCQGELYPGEFYFELEGRAVCEDCLGRYAGWYFAAQRRRVGYTGRGWNFV